MVSQIAEVTKISMYEDLSFETARKRRDFKILDALYENRKIRKKPIISEHTYYKDIPTIFPSTHECSITLLIIIEIAHHGTTILRRDYLPLGVKVYEMISVDKDNFKAKYRISSDQFKKEISDRIKDLNEKFCLTEHELVEHAFKFIKAKTNYQHFRTQVEIEGCIIDGIAFTTDHQRYDRTYRIIGFEIKTNKDNYKRLYNQLNSYHSICDEVYLVIEDQKIPPDLPFYVGVLKMEKGRCKSVRSPQTLKHSTSPNEVWNCLLKSTAQECCKGVSGNVGSMNEILEFFNAVETIKRKLIWNQFIIGFHKTYVKEYIQLTDKEKSIVEHYFNFENEATVEPKVEAKVKPKVRRITDYYKK